MQKTMDNIDPVFGLPTMKPSEALDSAKFHNLVHQKELKKHLRFLEDRLMAKKAIIYRERRDLLDTLVSLNSAKSCDTKTILRTAARYRNVGRARRTISKRKLELSYPNLFGNNKTARRGVLDKGKLLNQKAKCKNLPKVQDKNPRNTPRSKKGGRSNAGIEAASETPELLPSLPKGLTNDVNNLTLSDDDSDLEIEQKEAKIALQRRNLLREARRTHSMFAKTLVNINRRNSGLVNTPLELIEECDDSEQVGPKDAANMSTRSDSGGNGAEGEDESRKDEDNRVSVSTDLNSNGLTKPDLVRSSSIKSIDTTARRPNNWFTTSVNGGERNSSHEKSNVLSKWRRNTWDNFRQLDKIREDLRSEADAEKELETGASRRDKVQEVIPKLSRRHTEPAIGNDKPHAVNMDPKIMAQVDMPGIFERVDALIAYWKASPPATAKTTVLQRAPRYRDNR